MYERILNLVHGRNVIIKYKIYIIIIKGQMKSYNFNMISKTYFDKSFPTNFLKKFKCYTFR
jgi:hypothetical protein